MAALLWIVFVRASYMQNADPLSVIGEEHKQELAAPVTGVTTNGVLAGLFPIRQTGVATRPIRVAAEAFLNGLRKEQRTKTSVPVNDRQWRIWNSFPVPAPADGVSFEEMSERQRELAFDLFRASLSAEGLQKTTAVMKLNETFAELRPNEPGRYGQWKYWMALMGTPSDREPWGWQLEGHHLVINYFVLGDQVVMTPTFMGSQPVEAETGKFKGTVALKDEQDKGLKLFTSLTLEQRAKDTVRNEEAAMDTLAGI